MGDRRRLVGVELFDAAVAQDFADRRIDALGKLSEVCLSRRKPAHSRDPAIRGVWPVSRPASQTIQSRLDSDVLGWIRSPGWQHGAGDHKAKPIPRREPGSA